MNEEELNNVFMYHPPTIKDIKTHEMIRQMGKESAIIINSICPDCREKSLAITKIEEAVMWANAAVARNK